MFLFDGIVLLRRGFIDEAQCSVLKDFFLSVKGTQFVDGITSGGKRTKTRLTNRMCSDKISYPKEVYEIQAKVISELGLRDLKVHDYNRGYFHGKDGIVVSITFPSGDVYRHVDPNAEGADVLRANVLLSGKSTVIVRQRRYDIQVGDLMSYLVSVHEHEVPEVSGEMRIMMMCGFEIPRIN